MNCQPNPMRGEASIHIDGKAHLLRPSFEALLAAEEELGSLFALVERASAGSLTIGEITGLMWHCIADADRPERSTVGKAILAMGLIEATKPVRAILAQVLKGQK